MIEKAVSAAFPNLKAKSQIQCFQVFLAPTGFAGTHSFQEFFRCVHRNYTLLIFRRNTYPDDPQRYAASRHAIQYDSEFILTPFRKDDGIKPENLVKHRGAAIGRPINLHLAADREDVLSILFDK